MKFYHIADVHLGMKPEKDGMIAEQRERELFNTFFDTVKSAGEDGADLLLIAGDLFHRQPKVRELKEVDSCFASVPNVQVVIIAGNHDYIGGSSPLCDFAWSENVHFIKSNEFEKVSIDSINTDVYGFSYCTRNLRESMVKEIAPEDSSKTNILLLHGGDPSNVPFTERELDGLQFDYIALGHIHKAAKFGKHAQYAGSLEPLDKNETGKHGYIKGIIERNSEGVSVNTEFVEVACREYFKEEIVVDSTMTNLDVKNKISEIIKIKGTQNFYCFELTGRKAPEIVFDVNAFKGRACLCVDRNNDIEPGEVIEVVDKTVPDYDFDRLLGENKDNVIGMFIEDIKSSEADAELIQKALYYGVAALQGID